MGLPSGGILINLKNYEKDIRTKIMANGSSHGICVPVWDPVWNEFLKASFVKDRSDIQVYILEHYAHKS